MSGPKSEDKRSKKHKKTAEEKKRPRDEDEDEKHRKHKRSKGAVAAETEELQSKKGKKSKKPDVVEADDAEVAEASLKKEKKKKSKKNKEAEDVVADDTKSQKKHKKSSQKAKKEAKASAEEKSDAEPEQDQPTLAGEAMDIDSPQPATNSKSTTSFQPQDTPSDPQFPFFTQIISLYVPIYPIGFDKPITSGGAQHLDPLLNHYSPILGGVLLAYRNVSLSERSIRPNPNNPPTDKTPAVLESIDEYAVGFGWLTADVDLFIPSRGAWLEGSVNLQTEGHIGVVCWGKFNASIEAKRMPRGWKFVDLVGGNGDTVAEEQQDPFEEEADGEPEVEQMHVTGYWVDAEGRRIKGKLRFRVKNFDVGIAGDHGYLSIEGTMLTEDEEREMAAEEREAERRRTLRGSNTLQQRYARRAPAFSVTNFGREDEEEDSRQKQQLYKGSRPGTPDD